MSEVLIDVTWRGLEVSRQARLHEVTGDHGRVDVALPMPVGSALRLRAEGGLEIPAIVTSVHEQSTSGGETAGMVVAPALDAASQAWWSARAAESAAAPPSTPTSRTDDEPAVMIVAPADPTSRATMVFQAVGGPLASATALPRPTAMPSPSTVLAAPAKVIAAPPAPAVVIAPAAPTQVTAAAAPAELFAPDPDAASTAPMPAMAIADEVPEVAEDTSRTAIMSAVDVDAIIADGVANATDASADPSGGNGADDSGAVDSPSAGDSAANLTARKPGAPRGKRRKTR